MVDGEVGNTDVEEVEMGKVVYLALPFPITCTLGLVGRLAGDVEECFSE
jgi:hypothetical protein